MHTQHPHGSLVSPGCKRVAACHKAHRSDLDAPAGAHPSSACSPSSAHHARSAPLPPPPPALLPPGQSQARRRPQTPAHSPACPARRPAGGCGCRLPLMRQGCAAIRGQPRGGGAARCRRWLRRCLGAVPEAGPWPLSTLPAACLGWQGAAAALGSARVGWQNPRPGRAQAGCKCSVQKQAVQGFSSWLQAATTARCAAPPQRPMCTPMPLNPACL